MPKEYVRYIKKNHMEGGYDGGYKNLDPRFSLSVRDPWLYYIQIGKKTVEGRKGNKDKYSHWIGHKVYFYNNERKIPVKVKEIRHYDDLYKYLDNEGFDKVMPGMKSYQDVVNEYHKFYSDDAIKEAGGMLGIVVDLV
jgi:ASC-1-like (ASCH) protein